LGTTNGFEVIDCFLKTENSGAYAINNTVADAYGKWSGNSYKGMVLPVNSLTANQMINTTDNFGNIII
jgi:hypothetical protein